LINEDGEPTNSISAGSLDSHEPTDGGNCPKDNKCKTKIARRKKMSKYQEYKESLIEDHSELGWYELDFENLDVVVKNIKNLDLPPTDYVIYPDKKYVEFKNYEDMEAVEKLATENDPHHIVPERPFKCSYDGTVDSAEHDIYYGDE